MRELADAASILRFMKALGSAAKQDLRVYFTGGATAVLLGWRESTIDIDVKFVPELDAILREIPTIKETLRINVELASPLDFIPVAAGWEDRSRFVEQIRRVTFFHFDLRAQALAKVERGHRQDLEDVREMVTRELIDPAAALRYFETIEPELHRFPAIHGPSFRKAVEEVFGREP